MIVCDEEEGSTFPDQAAAEDGCPIIRVERTCSTSSTYTNKNKNRIPLLKTDGIKDSNNTTI